MKNSSLVSLFKEQLENESAALARSCNLTKRGDFLIWWYFSKLVGLSSSEIEEIICDGAADLGIDAIWIDSDDIVHFYSFKNPIQLDSCFPAGEVDKTISGLGLILARKHNSIANEDLRGRVEEIYRIVPSGYRLYFVTSGGEISEESKAKLNAFVSSLKGPSETFFTWHQEDVSRLQDRFYRKNMPSVDRPINFLLDMAPYQVRASNHDSYLFHTSGIVLAELYEEYKEGLLQQNIRVFVGGKSTNALIHKSASGVESANFFHYNNGVTFLCETASWDGFTRKLTLHKAQIVNGGQTVRVLHSCKGAGLLQKDVLVPVRIITSQGDKEFSSNVAVNLNNQNRVEPSFLRSNEPRVVQLATALASMGWYLERRDGEVGSLTEAEKIAIESRIGASLGGRVIPLKEGAQAYVATYLRWPEIAKKNPKLIFLGESDGGYFERVFGGDLTAERFVNATMLARLVEDYVKMFMVKKRRKDRSGDWIEDYAELLGTDLVSEHKDVLDQLIPQSGTFMTALVFERYVSRERNSVNFSMDLINSGKFNIINQFVSLIAKVAKNDSTGARSWPTLLKSQPFFERVVRADMTGRIDSGQAIVEDLPLFSSQLLNLGGD